MLSKRELLTRIKGKKVNINVYINVGGSIDISPPKTPVHYVITEVGEDVFEATSYVNGSLDSKSYYI